MLPKITAGFMTLVALGGNAYAQDLKGAFHDSEYRLRGYIDDKKSEVFACMFGSYKVTLKEKKNGETLATLEGKGFVVNARNLLPQAVENGKTIYKVAASRVLEDGVRLSAFCTSVQKVGEFKLEFFVKENG